MKIQKNFTTGILSGICGVLLLFVITGTTTRETTNVTPIYEFYDLEDTRGLIFNKVTGEIKYEEIREEVLQNVDYVRLSSWNGLSGERSRVRFIE
jgi:hypothetical protein